MAAIVEHRTYALDELRTLGLGSRSCLRRLDALATYRALVVPFLAWLALMGLDALALQARTLTDGVAIGLFHRNTIGLQCS